MGDLLFQYYIKKSKNNQNNNQNTKKYNKNIIHFFKINNINKDDKDKDDEKIIKNNITETVDEDQNYYKGNMKYLTKQNILSKYLSFTEEDFVANTFSLSNQNYDKCKNCNKEMLVIFSRGNYFM